MVQQDFFNSINTLIAENHKTYADAPKRVVADYNREVELTKEYNGRQILELLQNADDTESPEVLIRYSPKENKLTIANKGESFSIGGIESLMMANLSPKTKKTFIGNKGLGFRSILNWADKIVIHTNGCLVEFSPKIAEEEFLHLAASKPEISTIVFNRGLTNTAVPFPILSIPRVTTAENIDPYWTTVIEIDFKKEFEPKIKEQLLECREEILLFLNNIKKISIEGLAGEGIQYEREKVTDGVLTYIEIKDKVWRVETKEDLLPPHLQDPNKQEKESYNITVAFQDDLSDAYYKLFNFFPAKLSIHLPCIIHATFELNSSRDYLIESDKNKFILQQLVTLLKECALKMAKETEGKAEWRPFRMILPIKTETDSKLIGDFYASLKTLHNELKVIPCVDGSYARLSQIKYYGKTFSEFIIRRNLSKYLPFLLYPEQKNITESFPLSFKPYPQKEFLPIINELSSAIVDIADRAELITLILDDGFNRNRTDKLPLLLNDKGKVIESRNVAFTPAIQSEGVFNRPDFVNIDVIDRTLYETLIIRNRPKFDKSEPDDSREVAKLFRTFVNIQPYDSQNVITKIITSTEEKIDTLDAEAAKVVVVQMVNSLFKNFISLKKREETFSKFCPLISGTGEIKNSHSLFLSSSFPTGKITEQLYEGVLNSEDYVANVETYELHNEDSIQVEMFFIWLGVNRYAQLNDKTIKKWKNEPDPYIENYVFSKIAKPTHITTIEFKGLEIGLMNVTLEKLSNEKLLFLALKEEHIFRALELNNTDKLSIQYNGNVTFIPEKPSYISYQLSLLKRFNSYLIESNEIPFINAVNINYEDPILKQFGLRESQVNDVLIKLGAQESFVDLETSKVYELIKTCGDLEAEPKYARKLYLLALEHFKVKNENGGLKSKIQPGTKLLATRKGAKKYISIDDEDIYYSDNSTLPELITRDLWMFDFPKRSGGRQVPNYFSVKTFKHLKVGIIEESKIKHPEAGNFNGWFNQIKPLVLTYRITSLKKPQEKKDAANALKRCIVSLVSEVRYSVNNGEVRKLGIDEFLVSGNEFIICADSLKRLNHFKDSPKFCGVFAEIMCILFEVNEAKNNYISVFKDGFEFSKELIKGDFLEEYMNEAYELLGLSVFEVEFWKAVCKLKTIEWQESVTEKQQLGRFLNDSLHFNLPENYDKVDFEKFANKESIEFLGELRRILGITLNLLSEHNQLFNGVKSWHISQMLDVSRDIASQYANTIWLQLNPLTASEQKLYLGKINEFKGWLHKMQWSDTDLPPMEIELNYTSILAKMVSDTFGLELNDKSEPIEIHPDYVELTKQHDDFEKSLSDEQKSLLYFAGNIEVIKGFIHDAEVSELAETDEGEDDETLLPIVEGKLSGKIPAATSARQGKKQGGGVVDPRSERAKKKAGKKAEQKVRDSLIKEHGRINVQWVSGNSNEAGADDTLGYDFRYRKQVGDPWDYLEVKSVSGTSFIITNNEVKTAFENKSKYHMALVKDGKIVIDKAFFVNVELEQEYHRINSGLTIRPHDFEVYVDFSTIFQPVNSSGELVET